MSNLETVITKKKLKIPNRFQVILLNDDYTTMEFVVEVLMRFFSKSNEQANALMFKIHIEGEAVCGEYSFDVAQTKVTQVIEFSRKNDMPLMCIIREITVN
jgi:ATP-dependent Clp protease adaptor protein ClpS